MSAAPREMILASAGSGKTYRISSRLIGLLAYGESPDHVLAATFTRKAAGQILDRVLARLAGASRDPAKAAQLSRDAAFHGAMPLPDTPEFWSEVLARVVAGLHRFNVGTLDSFFMRAAGAFALELGLGPRWSVPDLPASVRLRSETLLDLLDGPDRGRLIELLRLSHRGASRRSVHEHLASDMEQLLTIQEQLDPTVPDPWSAFPEHDPADPPAEDVQTLASALERMPAPASRHWYNALQSAVQALQAEDWEALIRVSLMKQVAVGATHFDRHPIGPVTVATVDRLLARARCELRPRLARQIRALGELTREFERRYRETQRREGLHSFSDITRLIGAEASLGERDDLYYRLDSHSRHLLLDEFQDTSLPQWAAIAPLAEEALSDEDRATVIVADPKQSIYGWRGGEPEIVHAVQARYALPAEHMSRSWRSSSVVLELVNRIFGELRTNRVLAGEEVCQAMAEIWSRDFREHSTNVELPGYAAIEVGPRDESRSGTRPRLVRYAAARIAELHRDAPGFTIGVLARTNAVVARLFFELRRLEIDVSQEGGTPLTDAPVCEAILSLLRMVDHPGDSLSRYHVARSPLGAVVGYTEHTDRAAAEKVAAEWRGRLIDEGYGESIGWVARRVVGRCDAREARRLFQLLELAQRYDARASLRPSDFVRLVESERVEDRAISDVRVMTIHQAKGLEFDIVVLPQLDESILKGGRSGPVTAYRADPAGPITAVYPAAGKELQCLFPELRMAERQARAAQVRDALSTLYVGLTRARYATHAIICPDGPRGPGKSVSPSMIVRAALAGGDEEPMVARPESVLWETGDREWRLRPGAVPERDPLAARSLPSPPPAPGKLGPRRRSFHRQSPSQLHGTTVDVREMLRIDNADALDRGSIVHGWFETIAWIEDGVPSDPELLALARRIAPDLAEARVREALADFHSWLANPKIACVLGRRRYAGIERKEPELEVERELPFIRRFGDGLMEGVIDRVVLARSDGHVIAAEVIDFKTDRVRGGDAQVAEFAARYQAQLSAYVSAVSELYDVPRAACTASLVLLEQGRVVPVAL